MNEQISQWFNVQIDIWWTVEWMNDRVCELKLTVKGFLDRSYELMDEWINKQMNEWMNKWMNEQMNEWTKKEMNEWKKWGEKNSCNKEQTSWLSLGNEWINN